MMEGENVKVKVMQSNKMKKAGEAIKEELLL